MNERRSRSPGSRRLAPLRHLSQNFLADRRVAERIVEVLGPGPADDVVEVGPGRGALTELIGGRVARLVAIEIDRGLHRLLVERLADPPRVEIRHGDALAIPLASLREQVPLRVIANLPYGISSPFLLKLAEEREAIQDALILLQEEFARRLVAPPGTAAYGSLSVLLQSRLDLELLQAVGPGAFRPRPRVHSRLVRLRPLPRPLVPDRDWEALKALLRAAFAARRKMLGGTLTAAAALPRGEVESLLARLGLDPATRPQDLAPATWASLVAALTARGTSAPPTF